MAEPAEARAQLEARRVRARWATLLDSGRDPAAMSPEELRQLRYVNLTLLALSGVAIPYVPVYAALGLPWTPIAIGLSALGAVVTHRWIRAGLPVAVAAHLGMLMLYIALAVSAWETGGLEAVSTAWWLVLPMTAALLDGVRGGVSWSLVMILTLLVLALGHSSGLVPPRLPAPHYFIQSVAGLAGAFVAVMTICSGFLVQAREARARLEETLVSLRAENESRVAAEREARSALAARSRFLAVMSHEIRTPLNGVLGMNQLLAESDLGDDQREMVATAIGATRALQAILDDILDFSKLDAGKMELEVIPLDPASLARECGALFRGKAQEKGLALRVEVDEDLPGWVAGDPVRLRQVLLNLLGNAVKFTERGEVRLAARIIEQRVRFEVIDTGIGMTDEARQRLFRPFVQAEESTTRRFGGTGLGLSICRELVTLMGGTIEVASEPGKGSCFVVDLPLPTSEPPKAEDEETRAELEVAKLRVLVAEDNPVNQLVARRILEKHGHEIDLVCNGQEAVEAVEGKTYDLVLMDMQMPEMGGLEAARLIRSRDGRRFEVPIIALTANASKEDQEACAQAGMNDFISKPFEFSLFRRTVRRWADTRR